MKQEVTITLKVRLMVSDSDRNMLAETASAYRDACNFVSDYVFDTGDESIRGYSRHPASRVTEGAVNHPAM